jgi:hypothetical protein
MHSGYVLSVLVAFTVTGDQYKGIGLIATVLPKQYHNYSKSTSQICNGLAFVSNPRMARNNHTPDQFETIANELVEASNTLKMIVKLMRDNGMPNALIHGSVIQNRYLPAVLDWVGKTNADVRAQLRAYLTGVLSDAEFQKQQNANQKAAAAKKPFTPKPTKKKVT